MKNIKIGNYIIGKGKPSFIIAEAGVNHNGKLELAEELVDVAKEAGVDAVKFQTFTSKNLVTRSADMAEYQKKNIGKTESQFHMLKKLELPFSDFIELKKHCDEKGIMFLSTPHTDDAIDFLEPLVPAYKIASGDLTNIPFLENIAKKRKPIILSTGMGTLNEIKEAVDAIKKKGNKNIILLHCTTNYPCPLEQANLRAIQTLQKAFPYPIGYSDHTEGMLIPVMATTLGARVIEKHFTLSKSLAGPDHKASLEPRELKEMVRAIRGAEKALGSHMKKPSAAEKRIAKIARKSIIARRDIHKGEVIKKEMLILKRPGTGMLPKYLPRIIRKRAKRDIPKDSLIKSRQLT